jgi:hypothetical protein
MEKSNPNLIQNIKQKFFGDAVLLVKVRLAIAKTMFIIMAFLYFFSYLLVIGGYQVSIFNQVVFFLYPLFAFATIALLYNILRYAFTIYIEKSATFTYILFFVLGLAYLWLIATHIGFTINSLSSFTS